MIASDALTDFLDRRPSIGGARVDGWRIEVVESESLRAGVRDSRFGGPYEAPGLASRLGGSLVLQWSDGQATRSRLDRAAIETPAEALAGWRVAASAERRVPVFMPPAEFPDVQVYDPELADAVAEQPMDLLQLLGIAQLAAKTEGARRLDATLRGSRASRVVTTSGGLRHAWDETACSLELWIDELAGASYGSRRLLGVPRLANMLDDVVASGRLIRREINLPATIGRVIFEPAAVEALLGRFVLPALAGRAILDGRSPLSRDDLDEAREIVRADLDLAVDTTLPFELATAPCSADGVPGGRVALVQAGRLVAPILDPVTAQEIGQPPTPSPRGRPLLILSSSRESPDRSSLLNALGDGVIVADLPGLHTQGAHRWAYALVVPDAQVVRDGRIEGRAAVRLRGNLLEHLRSESTRLVRVPGETNPALLVIDGIAVEPA